MIQVMIAPAESVMVPAMITHKAQPGSEPSGAPAASRRRRGFPPLPLFILQPLLSHIVTTVAGRHPELFVRLGASAKKRFLIDPENLPVQLLLQPDPDRPQLTALNRDEPIEHDVRISGSFLSLLQMIDGRTDSDALFFNRDLVLTGDTEAGVALRNALDDMDETLADDVAACFGLLSRPVRAVLDLSLWYASRGR